MAAGRGLTGKGEMSGSLSLDFRHFSCSTEGEKAKTDDDEMKRCSPYTRTFWGSKMILFFFLAKKASSPYGGFE